MKDSAAYKFAKGVIDRELNNMACPKPRPVENVSEMMDDLLSSSGSASSQSSLHDRIHNLIKKIEPYIYGYTPMCKALNNAQTIFNETNSTDSKVLFILSDGAATDGDPLQFAQTLHGMGVTIATCYLTSDHIPNSKCLYDPNWRFDDDSGRQKLLEMSSTMRNTQSPVSLLTDAGWTLPSSGESRLFIQANSLDVVNEFCERVVAQMDNN